MLTTSFKSLRECSPSWKYGDISFALLKISSLSKISWTANPAATAAGIPAAVAAGLAVQDIFDKEDIFNRAKEMSPYFQDGLQSLKDLKEIVSIRGYGMMGGVEMRMKDKPGKSGFQTFKHCYDAGVNFKNTGDTLIIAPQFICEKKHIDEIIEKLRTGISNYSKS